MREFKYVIRTVNDRVITTSLIIAEAFKKRHDNVLTTIKKNITTSPEKLGEYYESGTYVGENGKPNEMYRMSEKGFMLLVMGFTGKKALKIKIDFIEEFHAMKALISETVEKVPNTIQGWSNLTYDQALNLHTHFGQYAELLKKMESTRQENMNLINENRELQNQVKYLEIIMETDGTKSISQTAMALKLGYGSITLYKKMREIGLIRPGKRQPYQRAIDLGWLTYPLLPIKDKQGNVIRYEQATRITEKGMYYLAKKLGVLDTYTLKFTYKRAA